MTKIEALRTELKCREMVEDTGLDWWRAIRHPAFKFDNPHLESYHLYELDFALGSIEGKPVWEGDIIYAADGKACLAQRHYEYPGSWSWTPPKPQIPEGFTPWSGGECPVAPDTEVEVLLAHEESHWNIDKAKSWRWSASCSGTDIIAYRVIKPKTIMVEVTDDVKFYANKRELLRELDEVVAMIKRRMAACRKALEAMK